MNLYGYAGGDPINFSDPFGLCPDSVKTEKGDCPGGLSDDEWDKVETAAKECLADPARDRIVTALFDGRIRGANLGRSPGRVRRTSPDVIRLNRESSTGDGAFNTDSYGLARILAHEDRHGQQLRELDWLGRYASGTSYAFMDALEEDARGYASAQHTGCKP